MFSNQKPEFYQLKPLPEKGTIGIFSPSTPVAADKLNRGISYLESLGYRIKTTKSCYLEDDYLAGSGKERAGDLMSLVSDSSVDAIFCTRGGFGSIFMLEHLDYSSIKKSRKIIAGFSDVTALQWAMWKKAEIVSVSAGMVGTDMADIPVNEQFEFYFWELINNGTLKIKLDIQKENESVVNGYSLPGTMSVGAMLAGTPFFPDTKNAVIFLEDVDEPRHKIEAYLQQYRIGGHFDRAAAIILGKFSPASAEQYEKVPDLNTVFNRAFSDCKSVVVQNFHYGHVPGKISLPVGLPLSVSLGLESEIKTIYPLITR